MGKIERLKRTVAIGKAPLSDIIDKLNELVDAMDYIDSRLIILEQKVEGLLEGDDDLTSAYMAGVERGKDINEALRKTCEATQDGTLRKELDKMKELHRCPECNLLMGHDDNCPKIAREAKEPEKSVESTLSVFHKLMPKPSPTSLDGILEAMANYYFYKRTPPKDINAMDKTQALQAIRQFIRGELKHLPSGMSGDNGFPYTFDQRIAINMFLDEAIERLCK